MKNELASVSEKIKLNVNDTKLLNRNLKNKKNFLKNNISTQSPSNTSFNRLNSNKQNSFSLISKNYFSNDYSFKSNVFNPLKPKNLRISDNISNINLDELISIDKYNSIINETMVNYRNESQHHEIGKVIEEKNQIIPNDPNENSKSGDNIIENPVFKIVVKNKEFVNPKETLNIINTNKVIYDNVSTSLYHLQKIYYDKTVKSIEHFEKWKKKMLKFKVTSIVNKNVDNLVYVKKNSNDGTISDNVIYEKEFIKNLYYFRDNYL